MAKTTISKKNKTADITLPDFKLYYKATVTKTAWCQYKIRDTDQWNKIDSPEMRPHTYNYLIFTNLTKTNNGKRILYLIKSAGITG